MQHHNTKPVTEEKIRRNILRLQRQLYRLVQTAVRESTSPWDSSSCFIEGVVNKSTQDKIWLPVWRKNEFIILKPEVKGLFLWHDLECDWVAPHRQLRWHRERFYRYTEEKDGSLRLAAVDPTLQHTDYLVRVTCAFKSE